MGLSAVFGDALPTPDVSNNPQALFVSGIPLRVQGSAVVSNSIYAGNTITATNGFASYTTAATNTVAATGWTNTFGVNAKVRITGTDVAVTIKAADESVLDTYTLGTADTVVELLQPLQAITAASGLVGTAKPF